MTTLKAQPVDTRKAPRRPLRFDSLAQVREEIDRLASGRVRTTGNWSLAQAVDHLAASMEGSLDGLSAQAPWFIRMLSPLFRKRALHKGIDPGIQLTGGMRVILPTDGVTLNQAMARIDRVFERLEGGERMNQRSPVFGSMTHEEWTPLHLRHAELHLSYIQQVD